MFSPLDTFLPSGDETNVPSRTCGLKCTQAYVAAMIHHFPCMEANLPSRSGVHTKHLGETWLTVFQHWEWPSTLSVIKRCQPPFKVTGVQDGVVILRSCWHESMRRLEIVLQWECMPPPEQTASHYSHLDYCHIIRTFYVISAIFNWRTINTL